MKSCCTTLGLGIVLFLACESCAHADNVYVSDSTAGTILQFNASGNESVFASGLDNPTGLAFDGSGNLYVANSGAGTILQYNSSGGGSVFASGLNNPTGLAFDGSGNLYVANSGAGTILQYTSSGNGSVFASGLYQTGYLAVDGNGNLYASTPHNIQEFGASGGQSTIFSAFNFMSGIAPDNAGNLYVGLQNAGSIAELNSGAVIGSIAFNDPLHTAPTGLAFGSGAVLYAAFGGVGGTYNPLGGTIEEYGSTGNGILLASGLDNPQYLAVQSAQGMQSVEFVPEPSSFSMAIAGVGILLAGLRLRQRRS